MAYYCPMSSILETLKDPRELESLSIEQLDSLAADVRGLIIETVSSTGGHLAANLGVVELTIALLRTFRPPADKLVWDVSHQAYAYKILTDRRDRFGTLRQKDGISGFLKRDESPYDAFGAGHAGTAISAALGYATARDLAGRDDQHVVAIVGDASVCNGMALEALNNVASSAKRLVVILNDNDMSIGQNVGALSRYFGKLLSNPRYNRWKSLLEKTALKLRMGPLRPTYHRVEEAVKSLVLENVLFEEFGLRYIGPIDGHDMGDLLSALAIARDYDRPILLHITTQKGRGYPYAEQQPERWHATSCFDVASGEGLSPRSLPDYSSVFGTVLTRVAEHDERVVAITAAMCMGTGLDGFASAYPDRFFDVGICEEHAVTFAAGLAADGLRPVVALYSTFLQRAVDGIIHDACLQRLPVVFCVDRAGVVGNDGPTHHGVFDIAILRAVPHLVMMQPRDEDRLARMLATALDSDGPCLIRYPRGHGPGAEIPDKPECLPIGKAEVLEGEAGCDVWLWALGDMIPLAKAVAEMLREAGFSCGVVDPQFIKPLDHDLLREHADTARLIVTAENGMLAGGFGSAVLEALAASGTPVMRFGWPDAFVEHGTLSELFEQYGLTADAIAGQVRERLGGG